MTGLRPLQGYVVDPEHAAEVVSPAYDALTPTERAEHVADHPRSFLSVLPDAALANDEELAAARRRVEELIAQGVYAPRPGPFAAVYQLREGGQVQTGLVGGVPLEWGHAGRIRAHEATRPERVRQIVRFFDQVGVASSPVSLAFRGGEPLAAAMEDVTRGDPHLDIDRAGVRQRLWVLDAPRDLLAAAAGLERLYITDGHHRTAAALARRTASAGGHPPLLAVLFPARELRLVDYHRIVHQPAVTGPSLIGALEAAGWQARALDGVAAPERPGRMVVLSDAGRWLVQLPADDADDPVASLDVSRFQRAVLSEVLGIADVRSHDGIEFVPGDQGIGALAEAVTGTDALAFALHPPTMDELMAVADQGAVMPPKSTYFTPKVRSGLLLRFQDSRGAADDREVTADALRDR